MSRHISPETKLEIRELVDRGYSKSRIALRLGIGRSALERQLRNMGLRAKKEEYGLAKLYRVLQGGR
jgi:transposase-like protein